MKLKQLAAHTISKSTVKDLEIKLIRALRKLVSRQRAILKINKNTGLVNRKHSSFKQTKKVGVLVTSGASPRATASETLQK